MSAVGLKALRWTPERLRKYQGFENHSDEEAEKAIDTIDRLARILLNIYKKNQGNNGQPSNSSKLWKRRKENQE